MSKKEKKKEEVVDEVNQGSATPKEEIAEVNPAVAEIYSKVVSSIEENGKLIGDAEDQDVKDSIVFIGLASDNKDVVATMAGQGMEIARVLADTIIHDETFRTIFNMAAGMVVSHERELAMMSEIQSGEVKPKTEA